LTQTKGVSHSWCCKTGRFEQVFPKENIVHCTVVPGFYLDVRWLLSHERPPAYQVLQQLLGNA